MIFIADSNDVHYGLLDTSDIEEVAGLLAEVFSRFEPMAVAIGLPFDEIYGLVKLYGMIAQEDGLTVIARAKSSGKLIGAMLTVDFASQPPSGIENVASRFKPISALLDKLDVQYQKTNSVVRGRIMHLFMLGVSCEFVGKKTAQTLIRLALENGIRKGYGWVVTEATGKVSQHILHNLGFVELSRIVYKEFTHLNKRIFKTIEEHEAVILMERSLP